MKTKKAKTMIERLRDIRDQISLETMDMNFDQLQHYFSERNKRQVQKKKRKSKSADTSSLAAEPRAKYGKK
jgi:hypothetical protein